MSKKFRSNVMLLITAFIWGSAFVAQKAGTVLEPFTYNGLRMIIGGIALIPVILIFSAENKEKEQKTIEEKQTEKKTVLVGGVACGLILALASSLQQFGLFFETDAGKAGFITTLYIVFVPVLGLFIGKKVRPIIWLCVLIGAVGFYFLTMAGSSAGFVLMCAIAFACHILVIDHFSPKCDGVKMSCVQFIVAGVVCLALMAIFEEPSMAAILDCWLPILYCGVLSSGVGYTLQVVAQKYAEPTAASLILSLESVFAVIAGVLFAGESMTGLEIFGCIVIFAAVILAQLPTKEEKLK